MKHRWFIPGAVGALILVLVILLGRAVGQAQVPQADLLLSKSVDQTIIAPDELVIYTVTLTNTTAVGVEVSSLVDTLPPYFQYNGLAPGSAPIQPETVDLPRVQWSSIAVPASGQVSLRYWVNVPATTPLSGDPYTNVVTATIGASQYTADTDLLVAIGEVTVSKTANTSRTYSGQPVTYTIALNNSGYVPVPLSVVTDALPAEITTLTMTAESDILDDPADEAGKKVWSGSHTIPSHDQFVVQYAVAMPAVEETVTLQNQAWGELGDGTVVQSDPWDVSVSPKGPTIVYLPTIARQYSPAAFRVTKTAEPDQAFAEEPGAPITYTVVVENYGGLPGVVADIRDTLPEGFVFQRMLTDGDVKSVPKGTTGEIVWTGPFDVAGMSSVTVRYVVQASTVVGTYVNSATATVSDGHPPQEPATAPVEIVEPVLLEDTFDHDANKWTPFLNKPNRLRPEQWYWDGGVGNPAGSYNHNRYLGNPPYPADDALTMYLGPGAEEWTNYRYEMDVWLDPDTQFIFLWFRGHYQTWEGIEECHWVLGYYLEFNPGHKWARVWQTQTPDDCEPATCAEPGWQYDFSNPMVLYQSPEYIYGREWKGSWQHIAVEVRNVTGGVNIKGFVGDDQIVDFTDTEGTIIQNGTVGIGTYQAPLLRVDNVLVTPLP
jgi:uncharacterized repeat protein (TIGR01451 family)